MWNKYSAAVSLTIAPRVVWENIIMKSIILLQCTLHFLLLLSWNLTSDISRLRYFMKLTYNWVICSFQGNPMKFIEKNTIITRQKHFCPLFENWRRILVVFLPLKSLWKPFKTHHFHRGWFCLSFLWKDLMSDQALGVEESCTGFKSKAIANWLMTAGQL